MRAAFFLVAFSLVVLAGCLQKIGTGSSLYLSEYRDSLSRVSGASANQSDQCRDGACWCMVCVNGTRSIFPGINSLIGGYCFMDQNCTPQRLADLDNRTRSPNDQVRRIMIGQGPTFGAYALGNTYCADRLSMSVQWLIGSNTSAYTKPSAQRAMCFLSKNVIPMYILYSNGTNINSTRASEIGSILGNGGRDVFSGLLTSGPVGPAIVVTELNFNSTSAGAVAEEVRQIDSACGNDRTPGANRIHCYIAVAPKINDLDALTAVRNALSGDWNKVDLVAYGVDNHYLHGCDGASASTQALNFSSIALYNFSKPSIIPYILFDPGINDVDNSCNWTEQDVVSGYGSFFPTRLLTLQKRGVIGIAPYMLNQTSGIGVTNPLNCTNCGLSANDARVRAWFNGCQVYTTSRVPSGLGGSAENAIVFGNESGTICNANFNAASIFNVPFTSSDIMQPARINGSVNVSPELFSCDECLLSNQSRDPYSIFAFARQAPITTDRECKSFPEIDQWASARNLDPMLVRAFILTESNFDPCSAAKVCSASCLSTGCTSGCFPAAGNEGGASECYSRAYDEMYDPAGNCTFANAAPGPTPDWRWCAFGLMQSLEPPWTFWPAQYEPDGVDGPYFDVLQRAGLLVRPYSIANNTRVPALDMARACNPRFNPFSPGDSVCIGTAKLEGMMAYAHDFINSNRPFLNWPASDFDKDRLFQAYIAGDVYSGFWGASWRSPDFYSGGDGTGAWPGCSAALSNGDCWTQSFAASWAVTDTTCGQNGTDAGNAQKCKNGHPRNEPPYYCYGYTDFISFTRNCRAPFSSRPVDPGAGKVSAYLALSAGCPNNLCPDGKRLLDAMCDPQYGPLNPRYCIGPHQPILPQSGTPYIPDNNTQNGT